PYDKPSTNTAAEALGKWGARTPTLLVLGAEEAEVQKSFRNIRGITVLPASAVGVGDVIGHRSLVLTQAALEVLESRCGDVNRGGGDAAEGDE
ncbi:MAG: 50S ribosomal protein L4, partial [Actinomycetota bacterium]|nr:50S ribosomal protein L4 [Actinomycetota bacterium]